jgi:arsenite-transporting ATPase
MSVAGRRSPVAGVFEQLASRRVLLFGGKGGVGKTTISVAAALHFAEKKPTILFTTDPASNLADLFTATGDRRPATLTIEALDAASLYKRFLEENLANFLELGDRGTYLDKDELRRLFELSIPGVDELMAWMRIGELAEENADAMLIVDTAPTGHTLRMLGAADHFRQLAHALDAMQAKHRMLVQQLTRRNVRDALDEFLDSFANEAKRRREVLTDAARTAFVPVALSEPWVVEQTKRLIAEVRSDGIDVPFVVLNRTAPDCDCERCRAAAKRDDAARKQLAPSFDARRACMPLDTPERIREWVR